MYDIILDIMSNSVLSGEWVRRVTEAMKGAETEDAQARSYID